MLGRGGGVASPECHPVEPMFGIGLQGSRLMDVCIDTHASSLYYVPRRGKGASGIDRFYVQGRISAVKCEGKDASFSGSAMGRDGMYFSQKLESWAKLGCRKDFCIWKAVSSGGLGFQGRQPGFVSQLCLLLSA